MKKPFDGHAQMSACLPERVRSQSGNAQADDRGNMAPDAFDLAMEHARESIMHAALDDVPSRLDKNGRELKREAFNMARRFRKNGKAYFEFILAAVHAHFHGEPEPSLLPALG